MKRYVLLLLTILAFASFPAHAKTLQVGPGKEFLFPSVAADFAEDGDVIEIDASGDYLNDSAVWKQNNITITGVNGRPHLRVNKKIPNGKAIWVIRGNNVTVSNVEMSGAKAGDKNGAAIRLEGTNFHLSDCYIHSNQDGILGGRSLPKSDVLIEDCEFADNGDGSGRTHNIYIGNVGRFTLRDSYSHDALNGHLVKSRAKENYILYNRLFEGNASYAIDLPNGGYALVMGNLIYQGKETGNSTIVAFGAEGTKHPPNLLEIVFNSFLSERSTGIFIKAWGASKVVAKNNLFSGNGELIQIANRQNLTEENNLHAADLYSEFLPANVIISPDMLAKVINSAVPVTDLNNQPLQPTMQTKDGKSVKRVVLGNKLDIGAIEYR